MRFWQLFFVALATVPAYSQAQTDVLNLDEAVQLTRQGNGTIRAALLDREAAKSRVASSFSAFLPSITPSYRYDRSRTSSTSGVTHVNDGYPSVVANWQLFDSGQRELSFRSSKRLAEQASASATQTIRQVLFSVHQQFFDTLRAQELIRVSEASVERADEILKSTEAQIAAKQVAEKDRYQALADQLNARVDLLAAKNQLSNSRAQLRATIGMPYGVPFPSLEPINQTDDVEPLASLDETVSEGLQSREDLRARRFAIQAQELAVSRAKRDAGITFSLDASASKNWSESEFDSRNLTFLASIPLYDGNARKEAVRQEELSLGATRSEYEQALRSASAEIEAAYLELSQNRERLDAANAALIAAKQNYAAASEAQKLGAEGTNVITVLTAKISLVTAESNHINAVYDVRIAAVRLRLASGKTIAGE